MRKRLLQKKYWKSSDTVERTTCLLSKTILFFIAPLSILKIRISFPLQYWQAACRPVPEIDHPLKHRSSTGNTDMMRAKRSALSMQLMEKRFARFLYLNLWKIGTERVCQILKASLIDATYAKSIAWASSFILYFAQEKVGHSNQWRHVSANCPQLCKPARFCYFGYSNPLPISGDPHTFHSLLDVA